MTVRLFAFSCGWLSGPLGAFLAGERGRLRVPVPCYLVEHPKGRVLFDSGLHPDLRSDPLGRLGELGRVFEVELDAHEVVGARLAALGVDPAQVGWLVNSHLHFDHTGGNAQLPNARLVVQRREWEAGRCAEAIAANHYDPKDYDLGHDLEVVDGEHDLFGDGTVTCLPTHGHTPGHQALRVRLDSGEIVLAADACYLRRTLEELHLPGIVSDREAALESLRRLRRLAAAGARIFYGHDPDFWTGVPQAPLAIP
jgi:glyoxylase-like metal-dependent hydrolase (beta-lactamase superfamily II)